MSRRRAASGLRKLEALVFDNRSLRSLPIDPERRNFVRDPVKDSVFSLVEPLEPVDAPRLLAQSGPALELLGLDPSELARQDVVEVFSGNRIAEGMSPAAHCYCGYQFGSFSGQLGDGAAKYLGEVVNPAGERWELQLKGAGPTPYSRRADGRKVLRSSIREFLCSEHMHALGIPSTRAATVVVSDTTVLRDVFYTGNVAPERCSIVSRLAPTFLRFGSFEIFKGEDAVTGRSGPSPGNTALLRQLVEFTIESYFPQVHEAHPSFEERARAAFREIVRRTARLVAQWQLVGWTHGVLNTDNMSIMGLTLDYGPFGFMDRFDRRFVPNTSDDEARYCYENQPKMCRWNCGKLAEAWAPVLPAMDVEDTLGECFDREFQAEYSAGFRRKLGLLAPVEGDDDLASSLLDVMEESGADFTNTFRALMAIAEPASKGESDVAAAVDRGWERVREQLASAGEMAAAVRPSLPRQQAEALLVRASMDPAIRPYIPALAGVMRAWEAYERVSKVSDEDKAAHDEALWRGWLTRYAHRLTHAAEAAAAPDLEAREAQRRQVRGRANPQFVLRNHLAQLAIRRAEMGESDETQRLLARLQDPFGQDPSVPDAVCDGTVEMQRRGEMRGGMLVRLPEDGAPGAAADAAGGGAAAADAGGGSCDAGPPVTAPTAVTRRYDERPPRWAWALRCSCSS